MSEQEQNRREFESKSKGHSSPTRHSNSFRQGATNYDNQNESDMLEEKLNQTREQLSQMNFQLKCLGVKIIQNVCNCRNSSTNDIIEVIQTLISLHSKEKEKTQGFMRQLGKSESEGRAKDQRFEQLQYQNDQLKRNKNIFQQKIKNIQRDFKQKEDKLIKEKQGFLKEKRGWDFKAHASTVQCISKDQKIIDLTTKLQKIREKGDKTQCKNTFELMKQSKQISKSFYKTEFISMIEKNLEAQKKYYQINNAASSDILRQVFTRLKDLMHTLNQTDPELFVNQNVINIPHQHSDIFIKTIRKYIAIIQKRLNERSLLSYNRSNNEQAEDNTKLYNQLKQMHTYYNNWQELFQNQKNIVKKKFHFEERLNRIKNDDLHHIYQMMDEQNYPVYDQSLKKVETLQTSTPESDAAFREKIKFIMRESNVMNLVDRKMDQSLLDDTES